MKSRKTVHVESHLIEILGLFGGHSVAYHQPWESCLQDCNMLILCCARVLQEFLEYSPLHYRTGILPLRSVFGVPHILDPTPYFETCLYVLTNLDMW